MSFLLPKKESLTASIKRDEQTIRDSANLAEKSQKLILGYNQTRDKVREAMADLKKQHDDFKKSILEEKIALTNEVDMIRLERAELLKPVDEIILAWKGKLANVEAREQELQKLIEQNEELREKLVLTAENYGDKFAEVTEKGEKAERLINRLQAQEEDVHRRTLTLNEGFENLTKRESRLSEWEQDLATREDNLKKQAKVHRDQQNKEKAEIALEWIRIRDARERIKQYELRRK